jgi:uroporphyrinogen-III synthase
MRLLVTRPESDGKRTAAQLRARGCDVMLAPLLRIEPVDAEVGDGPWGGLVLTSGNAVRAVAGHRQKARLLSLTVFTVGARTADDARAAGLRDVISADGDLAALVRLIAAHDRGDAPLLYLAGEDRAGDLAGELAAAGIKVQTAIVYRAAPVAAFADGVRDALAGGAVDGVLHFSRRSAEAYVRCATAAGILGKALTPVHYCLSQAVADPLAAARAARIVVAEKPQEAALLALVTG